MMVLVVNGRRASCCEASVQPSEVSGAYAAVSFCSLRHVRTSKVPTKLP